MFNDFFLDLHLVFTSAAGYLAPSVVTGAVLMLSRRASAPLRLLHFSGVCVHEMLHFVVGLVTMARPTSMSLVPRTEGGRLVLGSVSFVALNWLNAWITALAPLLALPIIYGLANWRLIHGPQHFQWADLLIWLLIAPQLLNCWPSRADWKLVLISWPLVVMLAASMVVWTWAYG